MINRIKSHLKRLMVLTSLLCLLVAPISQVVASDAIGNDQTGEVAVIVNGIVNTQVYDGARAFIGGQFNEVSLANGPINKRKYFAEVDVLNSKVSDWDLQLDNSVEDILIDGDLIIIAGKFTKSGDRDLPYIAFYDRDSREKLETNIKPDGPVYAILKIGDILYLGGDFKTINDQKRNFIASYLISSKTLTTWNPNFNEAVYDISSYKTTLFVAGKFTKIDGLDRKYVGAFDLITGKLTKYNPQVSEPVRFLNITDGQEPTDTDQIRIETNMSVNKYVVDLKTADSKILTQIEPTKSVIPNQNDQSVDGHDVKGLMIDKEELGFNIPTLSELMTFAVRIFFAIAGLAALFYLMMGAFAWITSGGDKDSITAAREKIQAALVGVIMIVVVLGIAWTVEQVVFNKKICFGVSCPLLIPSIIKSNK